MFKVENLSNKIGHKFASISKMDKDQEEVIAYGAFIFIQKLFSIFLVVVVGSIFGVMFESLVVFFTSVSLRKYSGGVHASTPNRCLSLGTIISVGLSLLIKVIFKILSIELIVILGIMCFIISYYIVYKLSPVDSPTKPITKVEKKQYLKKCSLKMLNFLLIITSVLILIYIKFRISIFYNFIGCLYIGALWQAFTLTSIGHRLIFKIDSVLNKITLRRSLNEK